mmetsp:Transcript_108749/g.242688  ORF Transcript_108749/g.242688 Transcript_108749/m.242688 type:complete len:221 (-) Transcript_108749:84-746(-)
MAQENATEFTTPTPPLEAAKGNRRPHAFALRPAISAAAAAGATGVEVVKSPSRTWSACSTEAESAITRSSLESAVASKLSSSGSGGSRLKGRFSARLAGKIAAAQMADMRFPRRGPCTARGPPVVAPPPDDRYPQEVSNDPWALVFEPGARPIDSSTRQEAVRRAARKLLLSKRASREAEACSASLSEALASSQGDMTNAAAQVAPILPLMVPRRVSTPR